MASKSSYGMSGENMRAKLGPDQHGVDSRLDDSIAIIGFSFEFPGGIESEDALWNMLLEGRHHEPEIPRDRFNSNAYGPGTDEQSGILGTKGAHFLKSDIAAFDTRFFSISPSEAQGMDPQQRKLLETTFWALEDAGIPAQSIRNSSTSVHMGCFTGDYHQMQTKDPDTMPTYHATGNSAAIISNRISWFFDLKGQSTTVDTACSSSLVALDQACQGLRLRHTCMSIVGGCNIICTPESTQTIGRMGFLSPDGVCRSFDEHGNGYARSEGFAVVILKRVSDAIRDGDTIRAVIRATATNQDGRTMGLAQPCGQAQECLLRETYRRFDLKREPTRFVEAHGTGTAIGDPIEANALSAAFSDIRHDFDPVHIGATKANVGHLEAASGVAGIIKAVLVLEKGVIPPIAQLRNINSRIYAPNLQFPKKTMVWPQEGLRRASVQSFGFGGSNAHVVLDDAFHFLQSRDLVGRHCTAASPSLESERPLDKKAGATLSNGLNTGLIGPRLLIWSAPEKDALARTIHQYSQYFSKKAEKGEISDDILIRVADTLGTRRSSFRWKSFLVAQSYAQMREFPNILPSVEIPFNDPNLTLVFTGQGAQWPGMGQDLCAYPIFRQTLTECQGYLVEHGFNYSLMSTLNEGIAFDEDSACVSQTLCTALQVALVDLLRYFGLRPTRVVGHSSGEIAAAYSIGAISARDAIKLAYFRGKLSDDMTTNTAYQGSMMAVGLSQRDVIPYLQSCNRSSSNECVVVGCNNSPRSVTLSGDRTPIMALLEGFREKGIFARTLNVPVAYHSKQMTEIASIYEQCVGHIKKGDLSDASIRMVSSVTGGEIDPAVLLGTKYWIRNMVSPVEFCSAMTTLLKEHPGNILEIGPHSALRGPVNDVAQSLGVNEAVSYHSLLSRNQPSIPCLMKSMGELYIRGHSLDIAKVNLPSAREHSRSNTRIDLPRYPYDHSTRYWHESRISKDLRFRRNPPHDLLGSPVADWNPLEPRWRNIISLERTPYIEDHKINKTIVYPAAAMIAGVVQAAQHLAEDRKIYGYEVKDIQLINALIFAGNEASPEIELRFKKQPKMDSATLNQASFKFRLYSFMHESWTQHCKGTIVVQYAGTKYQSDADKMRRLQLQDALKDHLKMTDNPEKNLSNTKLYEDLFPTFGYQYGPTFQSLDRIVCDGKNKAAAQISPLPQSSLDRAQITKPHVIHPAALDAVPQLALVAAAQGGDVPIPTIVPQRIPRIWISSVGLQFHTDKLIKVIASSTKNSQRSMVASCSALDPTTAELLVHVEAFQGTSISHATSSSQTMTEEKTCFRMNWKPDVDVLSSQQLVDYCMSDVQLDLSENALIEFEHDATTLIFDALFRVQDASKSRKIKLARPYFERYMKWVEHQLHKFSTGKYAGIRMRYETLKNDPEGFENVRRLARNNKIWRFYAAVAENLVNILDGTLDPLQLLFGQDYATEFYEEGNLYSRCGKALANYLTLLAHKSPGLRVLEVGAGTGSTTRLALEALDPPEQPCHFSTYDFTDISPTLVSSAQENFGSLHPNMHFKQFDLEREPEQQGFESGFYDVILAGSVLHATADISAVLQSMRALLKPGGKLVMFENVKPDHVRMGFAFGLLPGWWLGLEDSRKLSPCLTKEQWHASLEVAGFSGTELELRDFVSEECHEMSVIVSTAIEAISPQVTPYDERSLPLIIADANNDIDSALATSIQTILQKEHGTGSVIETLEAESAVSLGRHCILLGIRNESPSLSNSQAHFDAVHTLLISAASVTWVTNGGGRVPSNTSEYGILQGLTRTFRREHINACFTLISLEAPKSLPAHHPSMIVDAFAQMRNSRGMGSYEPEYMELDGLAHISRLFEYPIMNKEVASEVMGYDYRPRRFGDVLALKLSMGSEPGLHSFQFIEDTDVKLLLEPDEIEIEVKAIGCNFMDGLSAMGRVDVDFIGLEVAGTVTQVGSSVTNLHVGSSVMAFALDAYRTFVRVKACLAVPVPSAFSFVQAASIPINFATAYHALVDIARLQQGETVLVHSAAGGTGQSAVQIAQHIGAEIIATVSSDKKRDFLIDRYGLSPDRIFSSRNASFAQGTKRATAYRGVDVVLNSLSGDLLHASWECVAPYGRFIEIGKADIREHSHIDMAPFAGNTLFASVDLAAIIKQRPKVAGKLLYEVTEMINAGRISLVDTIQYEVDQIEEALRSLLSGSSQGKIVIRVTKDAIVQTKMRLHQGNLFSSNATYLIAGGLGGLGQSCARWMVERGAHHLLLLSRAGIKSPNDETFVQELKAQGVQIEIFRCDISNADALRDVLDTASTLMPPVRGCLQASMVLQDCMFENMDHATFNAPLHAKVQGSWNLHSLLPQNLDFFIMLSSVAGIFGSAGQANYAAGNTYQDALAYYLVSRGQRGVAIDLGMMLSEGYLAKAPENMDRLEKTDGLQRIDQKVLFALLERCCDVTAAQPDPQIIVGLGKPANFKAQGTRPPIWMEQPMFRSLHQLDAQDVMPTQSDQDPKTKAIDVSNAFRTVNDPTKLQELLQEALVQRLDRIMPGTMQREVKQRNGAMKVPLHSFGIDSLVAVELRNWFAKEMGADVATFEILSEMSLEELVGLLISRSTLLAHNQSV